MRLPAKKHLLGEIPFVENNYSENFGWQNHCPKYPQKSPAFARFSISLNAK